ncbi:MAG: IPT/TIG domain-containing protein [Deltaproteobacteria bacterium]|nr:IPT/TIG domain-containing protein [Deltaproteobacteria bacterium]
MALRQRFIAIAAAAALIAAITPHLSCIPRPEIGEEGEECSSGGKCRKGFVCNDSNICMKANDADGSFGEDGAAVGNDASSDIESGDEDDAGSLQPDAGADSGTSTDSGAPEDTGGDGGIILDTGNDTGHDAGYDAEVPEDAADTGIDDSGVDVGTIPDVGPDAGFDAGCDAGSLPALQVSSITPGIGRLPRGKQVTISGQGFDTVCDGNGVFFTGDPNPAPVISVTATQLKVRIPRNANTGIVTVKVGANEDNSQSVTIVRRLFLTREGSTAAAGQTFSLVNVETMQAFGSGTYQVGQAGQNVKMPTAMVLNPKQWKIYIISADPADEAHAVSVHDYAELTYASTVALTGAGPAYAGLLDEDQDRLLVSHSSGKLSAANTVTEGVANGSPVTLGSAAWGLDLDAKNGRYYVGATHQATGNGIIAIVNRADLSAAAPLDLGAGVVPMDVKYDPDDDRIYAVDFAGAKLHVYDAGTLQKVGASPVTITGATGPMSLSFGGTGADRKVFVACSNNVDHKQLSPHAALAAFNVADLQPVAGSPTDVGIVTTSEDQAGDFDQVRARFAGRDGFVIVTSDFEKNFGVHLPDLSKATINSVTSPFASASSKGNLGIAVEDW